EDDGVPRPFGRIAAERIGNGVEVCAVDDEALRVPFELQHRLEALLELNVLDVHDVDELALVHPVLGQHVGRLAVAVVFTFGAHGNLRSSGGCGLLALTRECVLGVPAPCNLDFDSLDDVVDGETVAVQPTVAAVVCENEPVKIAWLAAAASAIQLEGRTVSGLCAADELGKNSIVQSPDNALSPGARSGAAGVLLDDGDGRGAHSGRAQFGPAVRKARDVAARLFRRDDVALPYFLRAQSAFRQILEYARAGNHAARHLGNVFEGIPQDWQLKRIVGHLVLRRTCLNAGGLHRKPLSSRVY